MTAYDDMGAPWPERAGPEDGQLATFAGLPPLLWFLRTRVEDADVALANGRGSRQLLARAHARTAADRSADQATAGRSADQATARDASAALAG